MAEASSSSMDFDVVVDLHTTADRSLMNENSSNGSSEAGLNIKLPVMYTSSSDTETDDYRIQRILPAVGTTGSGAGDGDGGGGASASGTATTSTSVEIVRSSSPPPNCAICLGRCKNKCFTDSCVHQFCFKCLCEWSKVKAECPLCKQVFRSIIHNVKAIDQYEEYLVQQPVVQIPHSPLEVTYQGALNSNFIVNGRRFYNFSMRSWPSQSGHHGVMASRSGPITIRNFVPEQELNGNSIPSASVAVNAAVESLPMRRNELLNLYRQELPEEISSTMSVGQLWRRYIYDRKLYALPVSDITGRYRESSARFYRNNPGQRVRLIPFANRDIICLLRNTNHDVSTVLESLNEGLEMSNILSRSFRRRLQPFLGERTAHFIHELSNFARSPYDMIGYDRAVQYAPQATDEEHIIEFSSSSEEEAANNTSEQIENPSLTNTINLTTTAPTATATTSTTTTTAAAAAAATTTTTTTTTATATATNTTTNTTTSTTTSNEATSTRRAARRNAQASSTTTRPRSNAGGGTSEFRVQSRSSVQNGTNSPMSLLSFTITTTSEGSETPGLSVAVSAGGRGHAQVAAINLSTHNRAHNEVVIDLDDTVELNGSAAGETANTPSNTNSANITNNNNEPDLPPQLPPTSSASNSLPEGSPQIVASIALSTSSSDECEFVLERKPPHLRTPEMVSLNSESDSDVVFVDEMKPILAEATYSTSENEEQASLSRLIDKQAKQQQQEQQQQQQQEQQLQQQKQQQQQQQQQQQHKQEQQEEQLEEQQPSTSTGLRSRSLRQVVILKKFVADSPKPQDSSPFKRRRLRTRRITATTKLSNGGSTSESNDDCDENDSEYNAKRPTRSRAVGRKRTTRNRKAIPNRKNTKKRTRNIKTKKDTTLMKEFPVQDSDDGTLTNYRQPQRKKRRISAKRNSLVSQNLRNSQAASSKAKQSYSSSPSSSDEESSTEEDEKVNLKALQLRLKKSLSDVEDNVKQEAYGGYSEEYATFIARANDDVSVESNINTANSIDSSKNKNTNSENYNYEKNNVEEYSSLHQPLYIPKRKDEMDVYNKCNDDADSNSMHDGPSCSKLALIRHAARINKDRRIEANATSASLERPTTSAAAAAAAAAAVASLSNLYDRECCAPFEASNDSTIGTEETNTQQAQKEQRARYQLNSMSDASMSPGSVEPYVPQRVQKSTHSADFYDSNSSSSMASNSTQHCPSTSQPRESSNSPTIDMDAISDANANIGSDSSNSSTSSQSSAVSVASVASSSSCSESEEEDCDNDEHPDA